MNLQSQIIIFNLLFLETIAQYLSVSQSMSTITLSNQTISEFNSTFKYNTTIQIEGEYFKFFIVKFQQTSKDQAKVALLFNEQFPTFEFNKTLHFKDMDYDSYALKKQNHYLFIENMFFHKFITILSNISITFDLILTGTNIQNCLNNCTNNGNCNNGTCFCYPNFIGRDCSYKATEIVINTIINHTLTNYITFFYYQQMEKSKEIDLIFYTNSKQQNLSVLEIVSSQISVPTLKFHDFYGQFNNAMPLQQIIRSKGFKDFDEDDFFDEDTDDDQQDLLNGTFKIQTNFPSRLIIAVLCEPSNTQLDIYFKQRQIQKDKLYYLHWLLPTVIIIGIIILILIIVNVIYQVNKKRKLFEQLITYVQLQSNSDFCQICKQCLQNQDNNIVKLNICLLNHNFHKKCLLKRYKKNPKQVICPNCEEIALTQIQQL